MLLRVLAPAPLVIRGNVLRVFCPPFPVRLGKATPALSIARVPKLPNRAVIETTTTPACRHDITPPFPERKKRKNLGRGRLAWFCVVTRPPGENGAREPSSRSRRDFLFQAARFSSVASTAEDHHVVDGWFSSECDRMDMVCGQVLAAAAPCTPWMASYRSPSQLSPLVVIAALLGGARSRHLLLEFDQSLMPRGAPRVVSLARVARCPRLLRRAR
jgi:hypothetical protein